MNLLQHIPRIRGLNTRIITYFIAFAFVPLLVFSILGYYLNRDLLTRINTDNLQMANLNTANTIRLLVEQKQEKLNLLAEEYRLLGRLPESNELRAFSKLEIKTGRTSHLLFESNPGDYPVLQAKVSENELLIGRIDISEFRRLLSTGMMKMRHILFFRSPEQKLTQSEYSAITLSDQTLRDKNDFPLPAELVNEEQNIGVFSTYSYLPGVEALLVTKIDVQNIFSELLDFRDKIFIANLVLAIILIALAFIYSRRLINPIHKLIQAVQHIQRGNLDLPLRIKTNDEIEILANEFEQMRQKLQESYQGLEDKIELRTRELQEAQAQIIHQEKMASMGLMAAGIAHEIGNPLTSISSMAQVIKRKNSDEKINEYLTNILKSIDRISRIVRELVDFSRPSTYTEALVNLNDIINSAVGIVRYDRRSKHITFVLNQDPDLPKTVAVGDNLLQVILNILINAVDASDGYGNSIEVISKHTDDTIRIIIKDEGCGIPAEKLNQIFEPFFTTKEVGKGTGLGLTVSYGIIKEFGGEIKVDSEINQGSTFTIILPIKDINEENK